MKTNARLNRSNTRAASGAGGPRGGAVALLALAAPLALLAAAGCFPVGVLGDATGDEGGGAGPAAATGSSGSSQASSGASGSGSSGSGSTSSGAGGAGSSSSGASSSSSGASSSSSGASSSSSGASSSSSSSASSSSSGGNPLEQAAQLCVDTINQHRASIGLPPYARWNAAEACSGDQCMQDSMSGQAHGAFGQCGEWAQNECPGWPNPPEGMIVDCLQMMWNEGPGADFNTHGHYINMSSQQYTKVACGFYVTPQGSVWAIQNFN